uniref:Uncharacterized protein n=1 Tax=Anguilla anguilla TaxID=7936 RepID=A0A0E9UP03_ANGAN
MTCCRAWHVKIILTCV